ncbi:hypothetical protein Tco_1235004 [Tanacetum coccineum]
MTFDHNSSNLAPQRQQTSDYDNSGPAPQLQEVVPPPNETDTSLQDLELLLRPMYEEYFNEGNKDILKKHEIDKCDSIGTPMATSPKLDTDLSGTPVDQKKYQSMIGSLMYLTASRPDLVQSVCYYACYQARSTENTPRRLKGSFDAGHAGCLDTRKSTSRRIQFLGDELVSWMFKKQDCTTMSTAEAEYVALSASCAQVLWIRI